MSGDDAIGRTPLDGGTALPAHVRGSLMPDPGTPALVTILFVDIVDSTAQMARMGLEDGRDALDRALARIRQRIHQFHGADPRIQGDGVMAIFGAPVARADHALLACRAALAICEDFRALEQVAGEAPELPAVRVGLHSGLVLTRMLRNEHGAYYDVVGSDANFAKKVESQSPPNTPLATRETLDLAGAPVVAKSWGTYDVIEGRQLVLFELQAISFDNQVLASRHMSPLIGRADVLAGLISKLEAARDGTGAAVGIVGESGIGKSRTLFELSKAARTLGFRVEELRGQSIQAHTPFAAVKPFVLSLLGCESAAAPAVTAGLAAAGLPERLRHAFLELVGIEPDSDEWRALDAGPRRRAMFEAVHALVEATARRAPFLVLAEDAHDLDSETMDVLAAMKGLCPKAPILIVMTAHNAARLTAREIVTRVASEIVELKALSPAEAHDLCRTVASGSPISPADIDHVVRRATGNPLFLQEMIRDMRHAGGARTDVTPLNIASLVQARMAVLSPGAREVAQAAAILGDNIDRRVLALTAGVDETALAPLVDELDRLDLIDDSDPAAMHFRHNVFRNAVHDTLLRGQRAAIHRQAVRAYENSPQTPEIMERLANHCEMAGEIAGALKHLLAASLLAVRSFSLKTVRAIYDWAMRLRPKAPPGAAPTLVAITAASFDALQQSGDVAEYRRALEYAIDETASSGDRETQALARAHLALLDWMEAKYDDGRKHGEIAHRIAGELDSMLLRTLAQPHLANIEHAMGNLDRAIELHMATVQDLEGEHEYSTFGRMILPSVRSRAFAAWLMAERGRFEDAQAQIERGEAVLKTVDQPYSRVLINAARGILAIWRGRPTDALEPLEWARAFCLSQNFYVMESCISGWLATALVKAGNPQRAREVAQHSIDNKLYLRGGRYTWVYVHQGLAEALAALGDIVEALEVITTAVEIAEQGREPIHIAEARFARGCMRLAAGAQDKAREDVAAALALAEKHHLDPLAGECRRVLKRL